VPLGPIELTVIKFPGNHFRGEIIPELGRLVEDGTIRIIDIIFVHKNEEGEMRVLEINDLDAELYGMFDPVVSDLTGLLSPEDAEHIGAAIESNSSAALMLFENTWAARFVEAVVRADGELVISERIPRVVIEQLVAEQVAQQAA
jgi:hypothetical protein